MTAPSPPARLGPPRGRALALAALAALACGCGARTGVEDPRGLAGDAAGASAAGHVGGDAAHAGASAGASAGTGGGGRAGASAAGGGAGGAGARGPCPEGLPAPALVFAAQPGGPPACMDATEVSNAEYAVFLAAPLATEPASCAWKTGHDPRFNWPALPSLGARPVVNVDWCDASAYCAWAGKRLCGRPGGGPAPFASVGNAAESAWYAACSASGGRAYPYAGSYDPARCNGLDQQRDATVEVASLPCEGAAPGLFDMSGNVWEWQDACEPGDGPEARCELYGGSFRSDRLNVSCEAHVAAARGAFFDDFGFRCCAD